MKLTYRQKAEIQRLSKIPEYQRRKRISDARKKYALVSNYSKIAREVGCSLTAVRCYLNPITKEKQIINSRWNYTIDPEERRKLKKYKLKHYLNCQGGIRSLGQLITNLEDEFDI